MTDRSLPTQFKDLEPWLDWALPTEVERYARRIQTPIGEVKAFYAALQPHIENIIRYLSAYKWGEDLEAPDETLFLLGLAYMDAAIPVDLKWTQSENEGAFSYARCKVPQRR